MKDVLAAGEAFSPQKRTPRTSKQEISSHFFISVGTFALLDPDPDPTDQSQCGSIRFWIHNSGVNDTVYRALLTLEASFG
jgi:hypothetical protein